LIKFPVRERYYMIRQTTRSGVWNESYD